MTTMATDSATVVRLLLEQAWAGGSTDVLDHVIDDSYRSHIGETHPVRTSHWTGPAILRAEIEAYRSALPDLRLDVSALVADGETVATVWELTGTNTGEAKVDTGDELIAPSGAPVTATGFGLFVLADGRIREATIWWQFLGPLDQIRLLTSGSLPVGGFGRVVRDT